MTDAEREAHIKSCGELMLQCHGRGDLVGAQRWLRLQNQAIASRSPEQVAQMEACYFAQEGEKSRHAEMTRIVNAGGM